MESNNEEKKLILLENKAIGFQEKVKNTVIKQARLLITAAILLALLFYMLVRVTKGKIDEDFWITTIIGLALNIATMLIWVPAGKEKGEELQSYIDNKKEAARRISEILNDERKLLSLDRFSDYATDENRVAKIKNILGEKKIKYYDYITKYAVELPTNGGEKQEALSESAIKRDKHITKKQKRVILKVRKGVKVKPILSSSITALDGGSEKIYDVVNHESEKQTFKSVLKMAFYIISSVCLAYMAFGKTDHIGLEQIAQFLVWTGTVLVNIYTCRRLGFLLVTGQRNAYHLRLIDFSCRFDAWLKNNK